MGSIPICLVKVSSIAGVVKLVYTEMKAVSYDTYKSHNVVSILIFSIVGSNPTPRTVLHCHSIWSNAISFMDLATYNN